MCRLRLATLLTALVHALWFGSKGDVERLVGKSQGYAQMW